MLFAWLICTGSLAALPADPAASAQDLAAYEGAAAHVARSPEAHVELALWCEAHGLEAERLKHLALAVLLDPKSGAARGLMGLVAYRDHWQRPDAVAEKVRADEALAARLAEYNARRGRLHGTADAHWDLAVWCERNGLDAEAQVHFSVVTQLDPAREAAWKRLGCKKVGNRWVSEAQLASEKAEGEAQEKANKHWKPLLTKWRGWLGDKDKARRTEAEAALATVSDPHATPAVWSVFVAGSTTPHARAVQLLGQIDAAASSRALAMLTVFDESAEVRRRATETLKRRDVREFADLLIALLRDPIMFEVRPVGGSGSPGVVFIKGKRFNVQRLFDAPAPPLVPAVLASVKAFWDDWALKQALAGGGDSSQAFAGFNAAASGDPTSNPLTGWSGPSFSPAAGYVASTYRPTNGAAHMLNDFQRNMADAQNAAIAAQRQMVTEVEAIESYNTSVVRTNAPARAVLKEIKGQDLGEDNESWRGWWTDLKGYAYKSAEEPAIKPTYTQEAVVPYTPQFVSPRFYPSCFGAGTLVRTLEGSCPIESILVGDRVLTQDIKTGALGYHPVTVIRHNPPSPTFLVKLGGNTIVSSPFHRFWIAGKGWIMARDIKGGELLRLLDGPARVESVESGPVQPVYNLDVAEARDFFAGSAAALVHDNTLPDTRLVPFDAVKDLAATSGR